jgi:hypothetical protein
LHEEGQLHGSVNASSVIVSRAGAELLPPNGHARYTVAGADVSAFGALLYEMVTGAKPSPRTTLPLPALTSRNTPKGIRIAATRLATKCLRSTSNSFADMQKVLTEVRLLGLQARIQEKPAAPVPAEPVRRDAAPAETFPAPRPPAPHASRPGASSQLFTTIPPDGYMSVKAIDSVDPPPSGVKCPACGVPYVYPSKPRTWFETLLSAWKSPTLRCHRCLHRYISVFGRFPFSKGSPNKFHSTPFV